MEQPGSRFGELANAISNYAAGCGARWVATCGDYTLEWSVGCVLGWTGWGDWNDQMMLIVANQSSQGAWPVKKRSMDLDSETLRRELQQATINASASASGTKVQ